MNIYLVVHLYNFSNTTKTDTSNNISYSISNYTSDLAKMIANVRGSIVQVGDGVGTVFSSNDSIIQIVTSEENVNDLEEVDVIFDSGASKTGTVIGRDDTTHIAIINVECDFVATPLKHGDSDTVQEGDIIVLLGSRNQKTLETNSSMGILQSQSILSSGVQALKTDTTIENGNGAPLLNVAGEMIGMLIDDKTCIGINDINMAYEEIVENGSVTRGILGIQYKNVSDLKTYQKNERNLSLDITSGVLVTNVTGNAQGILEENDVITNIDHTDVDSMASMREILYSLEPSEECTITLIRNEEEMTVSVIAG